MTSLFLNVFSGNAPKPETSPGTLSVSHRGALMRELRILPRYARVFLYAAASGNPSMAAGSSGTRRSIQPAP